MMIKHKTESNMSSSGLSRRSRNGVESGRSMVEMLGVLAVVGVLSVGGIAGYTYAMNKHYANELLNGASQRAVILKAQKAAGLPLSLREFDGVEVAGGTFESVEELEDGSFGLKVTGVKEGVCQKLLKAIEDTNIGIENENGSEFTETNCSGGSFLITFANDLGNGGEGGGTIACETPIIKVYNCDTKTTTDCCPDDGNICEQPQCSCDNDDDCPGDHVCQDGTCGCLYDGSVSETVPGVCCQNGLTYDDEWGYYFINAVVCGCPEPSSLSETVPDVCCQDGFALNDEGDYGLVNIEACGCPEGGEESDTVPSVCCRDGKAWNVENWDYIDDNEACL